MEHKQTRTQHRMHCKNRERVYTRVYNKGKGGKMVPSSHFRYHQRQKQRNAPEPEEPCQIW